MQKIILFHITHTKGQHYTRQGEGDWKSMGSWATEQTWPGQLGWGTPIYREWHSYERVMVGEREGRQ